MFLLRSIFWLTLAFLLIRPEVDLGRTASAVSAEAMAQGTEMLVQHIDQIDCTDITCVGGKALAAAALANSVKAGAPMQTPPAVKPAPLPLPRPAWAG